MAEKNYGNNSQLAELVGYISDTIKFPLMGAGGGFAPIATIGMFMGTSAPQGWLVCDGHVYNITDYPELATYFASHFGASNHFGGDGTTTFAVPDLRGEFLRGSGTNSHENQGSGRDVGEHQDGTEIPFIGAYNEPYNSMEITTGVVSKKDSEISSGSERYVSHTYQNTGSTYNCFTSRPTNTSVLFCIKATVAGDPNAHQYSTEEQVVGRWIDGKPIYEKTIDCGALPNNTTKNIAHGISNLKRVIHISSTWIQSGTYSGSLENMGGNSNNGVDIYVDATNISIATSTDTSNRSTYVTIQYTKTTD